MTINGKEITDKEAWEYLCDAINKYEYKEPEILAGKEVIAEYEKIIKEFYESHKKPHKP